MAYSASTEYAKYLKKKCSEGCGCTTSENCSCCPPGLVGIYDDEGNHLGCLTPTDAEEYQKNTFTCQDGYLKLIKTSDGTFYGCVPSNEWIDLNAALNP